ncbi:MAG TPA: glycosyltransferase family 2 protein [Thermoguttaceae bacterium]|nr:glycosyltransferase family 2 protein [Thermoguttaceae bacterium]
MEVAWIIVFWTAVAALLYAQVGYALLLRLVSAVLREADRPPENSTDLPSVTLIIPAHNEETVLEAKLENALSIDYPAEKCEILVASDGSSDRTVEIARSFEKRGVHVAAFRERRGKTAVVNDAIRQATGEVVCVCDANVMFRPEALKRLVARLDDPRVGAVSGDVRLASEESDFAEGESAYYRLERTVQRAESKVGSMMGVDGGMYVLRRELFQPLPADTIVDDFVISMRVIRQGKWVVFEPTAIATENGTATARQEFQRRVRLSAGAMQVLLRRQWPPLARPVECWQFVSHKLLRWAGPVWLVLLLVSSAVLWNAGVIYRAALLAQVLLYGLAAVGSLSLRFRETRIGGIPFYFVMSHVAMAVGLVKGLLNLQRVTWNRTERTTACNKPTSSASS